MSEPFRRSPSAKRQSGTLRIPRRYVASLAFPLNYSPLTGIPRILIVNFPGRDKPQIFHVELYMTLSIGTKAPDFALSCKTSDGLNLVKLSDNFGRKEYVVVVFPDGIHGSVHSRVVRYFRPRLGTYEDLNAQVYGISGDSPFSLEAWSLQRNNQGSSAE